MPTRAQTSGVPLVETYAGVSTLKDGKVIRFGDAEVCGAGIGSSLPEQLVREIALDCDRALRRLDRLSRKSDDVVLRQARAFIRHAAALGHAIEGGELAGLAR
jgi:hypothetical protein